MQMTGQRTLLFVVTMMLACNSDDRIGGASTNLNNVLPDAESPPDLGSTAAEVAVEPVPIPCKVAGLSQGEINNQCPRDRYCFFALVPCPGSTDTTNSQGQTVLRRNIMAQGGPVCKPFPCSSPDYSGANPIGACWRSTCGSDAECGPYDFCDEGGRCNLRGRFIRPEDYYKPPKYTCPPGCPWTVREPHSAVEVSCLCESCTPPAQ
jgi:hypothetical protein